MANQERVTRNFSVEDAQLIFKNFKGEGGAFNKEGDRNFGLLLPDDLAEELLAEGWNVKYLRPRDDEEEPRPWIKVRVKFGMVPPLVWMINDRGKIKLNEDTIDQLDWSRVLHCDVTVRPYNYPEMPGRPAGVSAYLKAMYVTIQEDEFASKYADIPDLY